MVSAFHDFDSVVPEATLPAVALPEAIGLGLPASPASSFDWARSLEDEFDIVAGWQPSVAITKIAMLTINRRGAIDSRGRSVVSSCPDLIFTVLMYQTRLSVRRLN